jgi:hypothetical protein
MTDNLEFLLNLGFELTGEWIQKFDSIDFRLQKHKDKNNILYAFVVDESVMYIGKSTQTLYKRMMGYKNPGPTQSTNIKNNARIHTALSENRSVVIYVFVQKEEYLYRGVNVNLAAGLEDNLIKLLNLPWNNLGNSNRFE